ncbi:MAG: tRNA (adenosine(37)-N6)-dimethylallyltransferase MiaA [Arcobacteraceae bacterium]|jgi:tRNA dimethylallyltransferase|nr:tRNA (adenosine(37)-N6)-dimethylallyltransferase MiaA [Arcobacteraceae bacterium]
MKQIAIIAPTASGKTALSIQLAHQTNSIILSLDSLSIYKEIDISSAKPTLIERDGIKHFGIDEIYPNEKFDVMKFIEIYHKAKEFALQNNKNIIIVGGTGFYLKAMIDGISQSPEISQSIKKEASILLQNLPKAYEFLYQLDSEYMKGIKAEDSYRIEKALELYLQTSQIPTLYFKNNPPIPTIPKRDIGLFEIVWDREILRQRIALRTKIMIENGLLDEVIYLEQKYTRDIAPMGAIGLKEGLEYLDGKIDAKRLQEKIAFATNGLAKRQRTFNNGQFENVIQGDIETLKSEILKYFNRSLDTIKG